MLPAPKFFSICLRASPSAFCRTWRTASVCGSSVLGFCGLLDGLLIAFSCPPRDFSWARAPGPGVGRADRLVIVRQPANCTVFVRVWQGPYGSFFSAIRLAAAPRGLGHRAGRRDCRPTRPGEGPWAAGAGQTGCRTPGSAAGPGGPAGSRTCRIAIRAEARRPPARPGRPPRTPAPPAPARQRQRGGCVAAAIGPSAQRRQPGLGQIGQHRVQRPGLLAQRHVLEQQSRRHRSWMLGRDAQPQQHLHGQHAGGDHPGGQRGFRNGRHGRDARRGLGKSLDATITAPITARLTTTVTPGAGR